MKDDQDHSFFGALDTGDQDGSELVGLVDQVSEHGLWSLSTGSSSQ